MIQWVEYLKNRRAGRATSPLFTKIIWGGAFIILLITSAGEEFIYSKFIYTVPVFFF
jgi:hypothetical protein